MTDHTYNANAQVHEDKARDLLISADDLDLEMRAEAILAAQAHATLALSLRTAEQTATLARWNYRGALLTQRRQ